MPGGGAKTTSVLTSINPGLSVAGGCFGTSSETFVFAQILGIKAAGLQEMTPGSFTNFALYENELSSQYML